MVRLAIWIPLLALTPFAEAVPKGPTQKVSFLDLVPDFEKGKVLRNRSPRKAGIWFGDKRHRGLTITTPGRIGFRLHGAFRKFQVRFGVLQDTAKKGVSCTIKGDGRVLYASPPFFAGEPPREIVVDVTNVILLELIAAGGGAGRVAWMEGVLESAPGRDLSRFRVSQAPFAPGRYPSEFRRRVNRAIDRTVRYLKGRQTKSGGWRGGFERGYPAGASALVLLSLMKAGLPADDPVAVRGFQFLRKNPNKKVYTVACKMMALEAKYFPGGASDKDAYVDRPRLAKKAFSDEDRDWMQEMADWMAEMQGKGFGNQGTSSFYPVWRYPQGGYDLSNTQYALFGLAAAHRCGVPSRKVWMNALRFLLTVQEKDGPPVLLTRYVRDRQYLHRKKEKAKVRGFTYTQRGEAYGSMTTAGICSLILCQQALYKKGAFKAGFGKRTREAIRDGLAWLEEYYDVRENPLRQQGWWTYYLFNLERVGVLLGQRFIGARDWYREGAEELLRRESNGSFGNLVDTAFALLFLKRATVPAVTDPLR